MRVESRWRARVLAGAGMLACLAVDSPARAAVGSTEASYGVTANGAPEYTIAVRATEGVAGMTPRLAISWIGAGERSLLGMGFTIAGL